MTAEDALRAYEEIQPTLQGKVAQVMYDLAEALKEALPKWRVREVGVTGASAQAIRQRGSDIAATGLESQAAAQQWIADHDPAAHRMLRVERMS